jgi:hypothetical protein
MQGRGRLRVDRAIKTNEARASVAAAGVARRVRPDEHASRGPVPLGAGPGAMAFQRSHPLCPAPLWRPAANFNYCLRPAGESRKSRGLP